MKETLRKLRRTLDEQRRRLAESEQTLVELERRETGGSGALLERGALLNIAQQVRPDGIDTRPEDYVVVSGELHRTFYLNSYPPQVDDGWLTPLYRFEWPLETAIYYQPLPIRKWVSSMRAKTTQDEAVLKKQLADGQNLPDPRRRARLEAMLALIDAVERGLTKPFHVTVVTTARARSEAELDRISELLEDRVQPATTRRTRFKHPQGFATTQPLANNELAELDAVRFMHTQAAQSLFPFVNSHITHDTGVLIGQSLIDGLPLIINRFLQPPYGDVESPNSCIIGVTGSGKSFLAKLEMLHWLYQGVPVFVIDPTPGGEYATLAQGVGGRNVRIAFDSADHINPLDFSYAVVQPKPGEDLAKVPNALKNKLPFLTELLRVMLRTEGGGDILDPVTSKIFTNALLEMYRRYGYEVADVRTQLQATPQKMPTLGEVTAFLGRMRRSSRDPLFQEKINPLIAALENFSGEGQYAGLYDHRTNVDLRSGLLTVFSVGDVSEQQLPVVMHMVLEFLRTTLFTRDQQRSAQNKIIYVDEAQRLLAYPETAHFLGWTASTCRKFGVGLTVLTQYVGNFLWAQDQHGNQVENRIGRQVLNACTLSILLRQHSSEVENVGLMWRLTEAEKMRLRQARNGEGLLILGEDSCGFTARYIATEEERRLCSTTARERARYEEEEALLEALPAGADVESQIEDEPSNGFRPLGNGR